MGTIQSSGLVRNCQHERITCKMEAVETTSHHTGRVQFAGFVCPDCQQEFEVVDQRGAPAPFAAVNLLEKSKAIETVRGSVPAKKPDPSLARSRIARDGLKAGTAAPEFTLPTVAGAEVALADYRGRRLLLVFIHNRCPWCDKVAPDLQLLHESGFPVLGITNLEAKKADADREEALAKVAKLGLTFTVAMQTGAKVWRDYATFSAPAAYLIDASGILETDVIIGAPAIQSLIGRLSAETPCPA